MDGSESDSTPLGPGASLDEDALRDALENAGVDRPPGALDRALALVRFLRREDPWDARQTPSTLVPHLLEEAHEVVDAIRADDPDALEAELGDLLLNLAFQLVVAEEAGRFDAGSVTRRLERKIVLRHPHLFGLGEEIGWEEAKARERRATTGAEAREREPAGSTEAGEGAAKGDPRDSSLPGLLDGIPPEAEPLIRAHRLQTRAAAVGFDWPDFRGAFAKVLEEAEEVRTLLEGGRDATVGVEPDAEPGDLEDRAGTVEDELGDLLFAAVNLARLAGVRGDAALTRANRKFVRRFGALERLARERGVDLETASLEEMDAIWDEVKRGE